MFKKVGRVAAIALMLIFSIVLTGCNSSSDTANGLTTKDLPAGWSAANGGLSYDGTECECFYVAETALSNQDFQYMTDVTFTDQKRGVAALIFQSSEDSKKGF